MFINFSNHSSVDWSKDQLKAAKEYGRIVDIPFPDVSPDMDENDITVLANQCVELILSQNPKVVMCQGEFTLSYAVITKLKEKDVVCVAACSKREVKSAIQENGSTKRVSIFSFVRFREYA